MRFWLRGLRSAIGVTLLPIGSQADPATGRALRT